MATNVDNINNFINGGAKASESSNARRSLDGNFEDFLLLLTTQLKNQDPTAPTDTNELTQQIATLSQVEQQINTNSNLEKLVALFGGAQTSNMVSYIGKLVDAEGNAGALENGQAVFAYTLDADASSVTVKVKNSAGQEVFSGDGATKAGRNEIVWNGKNTAGTQLPDGVYTITVTAKNANGDAIKATPFSTGIVTSVDTVDGVTSLMIGDMSIPLEKVKSVKNIPTVNA